MIRWVVATLLIVHGLVHLMGFAKSFGFADLPQLTQSISRGMGLLWLVAALLVMASAVAMLASPRSVWIIGAVALALSQVLILSAWHDEWAGTVGNIILLLVVAHGWFTEGLDTADLEDATTLLEELRSPLAKSAVKHRRIV